MVSTYFNSFPTSICFHLQLAICLLFRTCDKECLIPNEFGDEIMLSVDMGLYLNFTTKKEWGGNCSLKVVPGLN